MAKYSRDRFPVFDDSDDDGEDTGGGVKLSDFESPDDDFAPTPTTGSATSSGASRVGHGQNVASSAAVSKPAVSARRNTIAPIGTGRPSEQTPKINAPKTEVGAPFSAPAATFNTKKTVNNWVHGQDKNIDNSNGASLNTSAFQPRNQASVNNFTVFSYQSPTPGAQSGYIHGVNAQFNTTTPNTHGSVPQHSQAVKSTGYPWVTTTPGAYNPVAAAYATPQTAGYGITPGMSLGANFPFMMSDSTPSHMPRKAGLNMMATPASVLAQPSQYNQTEPRNFAPRPITTPMFVPPPPAFSLDRPTTAKKMNGAQIKGMDGSYVEEPNADPFMSPTANRGAQIAAFPQALVLPPIAESNALGMMPCPMYQAPVTTNVCALRSALLNKLTEGPMGVPTEDVGLSSQHFPFIESTTQAGPVCYGVVKIKNIPFGTSRAEIIAFLGRNSKILNDVQEPVHIIMERVSSKTQDCYVEFVTMQDAIKAVERYKDNVQRGRPTRLGDRPVEVLLSSQGALMQDLFPLARGIVWNGAKPVIQAPIEGEPWKTFKGFVTEEEMTMLVKHVEIPQRSPYSKECPQRPYECMISTIKKLPWYMSECITVRQRHCIYDATVKLIQLLHQAMRRRQAMQDTMIDERLLKRLVTAAMLCPGFSVVQKDNIAALADMDQDRARMFNQPRFPDEWVHLHAICPRPGVPIDVLEWYIALVREETTRFIHRKSIGERNEIQRMGAHTSLYFGYVWYEMGLPRGKMLDNMTLREVAAREMHVLERVLRRVFPSAAAVKGQYN